ncbi:MAG: hypothetical protein EAX81_01120 [Candidatus Thorarchaeota archaeon]|nr:hypothetical protein [Candidatus Thorarchaeota archaeon]
MGLRMSPAEMLVARVVTHRDLERELLLALDQFGLFEFIDVTHQAAAIEVKRSRDEESVFAALERLQKILASLDIKLGRGIGSRIDIDESSIQNIIEYASEVIRSVEPEIVELDADYAATRLELDKQLAIHDVVVSLKPLGIDPSMLGMTEFTFTTAGVIPQGRVSQLEWSLKEVTEDAYVMNHVPLKRGVAVATLSVPIDRRNAVERILTAMEFESFSTPIAADGRPEDIADEATTKIAELKAELDQIDARKRIIAREWKPRILAAWELLDIESKRIGAKAFLVYTEQSVKAWGWIPSGTEDEFESIIGSVVGPALDIKFEYPDFAEHESPTYLNNPKFMKPTQDVVYAYGTPSKHDLDPTKLMFLSFPIIFGFVFSDVGQGFLIILIGLAAWRSRNRGDDWGQILGYLQSGAEGLILMGIFAMVGGFLFGSFFGAETVIEPLWPTFSYYLLDAEGHLLLDHGHPVENPYRSAHMLKLSIEIGVIHILLGILLNLYNRIKHHERREAMVAISYLILYLGFINLIFGVSYGSIDAWFNADPGEQVYLWIPIAGIGYGIGNNGVYIPSGIAPLSFTVLTLILPMITMAVASFKGGMDGAVVFLEYAIGMISHTVSYARIFALNSVHVILSGVFFSMIPAIIEIPFPAVSILGVEIVPHEVFNDATETWGPAYLPLLGAIIGTFIVGILEGLLAFMHTLRLHFVEWFSKFYHAGGVAFAPFKTNRIYTNPILTRTPDQSYALT